MLRYDSIVVIATAMALLFTPAPTVISPPADAAPDSWFCGPAGSLAKARSDHTATLLSDGKVLIIGGERGREKLTSAEIWDPATEEFGPTGSMTEARKWHTTTLLPDGRVLVVGGSGNPAGYGDNFLTSAEIWDSTSGEFSPTGSMTDSRIYHTTTLLPDGRILAVAGIVLSIVPLASAELWDPDTGNWTPTGSLEQWRADHTATLLDDGRVLVIGGGSFTKDGLKTFDRAEAWKPAKGKFRPAGRLGTSRMGHSATRLHDGRVLVVGGTKMRVGKKQSRRAALASAEVWDPATGSFEPGGSLTQLSGGTRSGLLPDGRVLVVGAISDSDPEATEYAVVAEMWDPGTASFSLAGSLSVARGGQTVTTLSDGRALIVGGVNEAFRHLASAEICGPESTLDLTTTVVGRAEEERMTPAAAFVTGRVSSGIAAAGVGCCGGPDDPVGGDAVWEMQWSDPRLPSRMLFRHDQEGGLATHPDGAAMAMQIASAVRLEGPDGDWVGTGWVLAWMSGPESGPEDEWVDEWVELLILDGEGDYEGLSATLTSTGLGGEPGPYEGFILEGDLPEWPDPIEP
jgi:hypothetical protein